MEFRAGSIAQKAVWVETPPLNVGKSSLSIIYIRLMYSSTPGNTCASIHFCCLTQGFGDYVHRPYRTAPASTIIPISFETQCATAYTPTAIAIPANPSKRSPDALVGYVPLPLELVAVDDPPGADVDLEAEELLLALVPDVLILALPLPPVVLVPVAVADVALPVIAPGPWLPVSVKYKLTAVALGAWSLLTVAPVVG